MRKIDAKKFVEEGKRLILLIGKVNEDGIFNHDISSLSEALKFVEESNEFDGSERFLDFYLQLFESEWYEGVEVGSEIRKLVTLLACVEALYEMGVITFQMMNCIEDLTSDDLQAMADILGSTITYDTNLFIVNNGYLAKCSSAKPSV